MHARDLTEAELAAAELMLHHLWPLLPDDAQRAFALEADSWTIDGGVSVCRRGDEWTFTTGGRLQDGWWIKLRPNDGSAAIGSPNNHWSVLRGGWQL